MIQEHVHDPYRMRRKPEGPLACPRCSAVYDDGRWRWAEHAPAGMAEEVCPACRRIADDCPAGIIEIEGMFAEAHREEIRGLLRNEAEAEAREHPMNRVLAMVTHDGGMKVTTTDLHLARRLGEALHRAFHGELSLDYAKEEYLLRVRWVR
ncbi:MAG: BCAM0308 family protein [Solirubrobacterales bacterium]